MKTHRHLAVVLAAAACTLGFWVPAAPGQKSMRQEALLRKAIQIETVDGDLAAAINVYQQILANPGSNRSVAAKAQLHLDLCYEKERGTVTSVPISFKSTSVTLVTVPIPA